MKFKEYYNQRNLTIYLLLWLCVFLHASLCYAESNSFYLSFCLKDSLYLYHDGHLLKGKTEDVQDISNLDWEENKSDVGKMLSLDFDEFINDYHNQIDSAPILLIAYRGTAYSYIESIECLKTYNLADKNIRLIDALQLSCYGNLPSEGKWMIANEQDTTYVDYSDQVYEFCKPDSHIGEFKPFVVKNESQLSSLIVNASAKYITASSTKDTKAELLLLCLSFPIQFINHNGTNLNSLIYIHRGRVIPLVSPSKFETNVYVSDSDAYSLLLSDGPVISANGSLCDPVNFELEFINDGPIFIEIDSNGIIRIRNNEDVVSIFDLVYISDNYQEKEVPSNDGKPRMTVLLLLLIIIPVILLIILLSEKDKAQYAISNSKDKNVANEIRSSHKRKTVIIALIGCILITITVIAIYVSVSNLRNFFWEFILTAVGIQAIGSIIIVNVQNKRRKYDSFIISTLTLKDVNLNEEFLLYLRGFKQDDYKTGGIQIKSFNEEGLFSEALKYVKSYAIGMTKELYAPTGATRVYFDDNEWKAGVRTLIANANAIIINVHNSENCIFEIMECQKYMDKTIFIALDENEYSIVKDKCTTKGINLPDIHFTSKEMCSIYCESKYIYDKYSSSVINDYVEHIILSR